MRVCEIITTHLILILWSSPKQFHMEIQDAMHWHDPRRPIRPQQRTRPIPAYMATEGASKLHKSLPYRQRVLIQQDPIKGPTDLTRQRKPPSTSTCCLLLGEISTQHPSKLSLAATAHVLVELPVSLVLPGGPESSTRSGA